MKKVGIITLTKNANYGNVLQNIAMQKIVNELGFEAETILNLTNSPLFNKKNFSFTNLVKWILNYNGYRENEKRNENFRKCCSKNLQYSNVTYNNGRFSKEPTGYEYFITGSDQVWNPTFGFATEFELLGFVPKNRKISYAASFGVDNLDMLSDSRKDDIRHYLAEFSSISVREDSGERIVRNLCSTPVETHVDPTLLLKRQEWEMLAIKPKFNLKKPYILVYMLGEISAEYQTTIKKLAKQNNAEIINALKGKCKFINPLEFIWLINNATYVCTDSFHASVFSIIFHTKLYIFNRRDQHANQNSRFTSLLRQCGIQKDKVIYKKNHEDSSIDWERVDKYIEKERERSFEYLKKALSKEKIVVNQIEILNKKDCCGCSACAQACVKKCITMRTDYEGFTYPEVDLSTCVQCGLCKKACPIINADSNSNEMLHYPAYAAFADAENVRLRSSSGGIFTLLAENVLHKGGMVFGAAFDDEFMVSHIGIEHIEEITRLQGSKYLQSRIGNTYYEAKVALDAGRQVLYSGTACQIAGLKGYLKKEYPNLLTLDVLCHGVPSPKVWNSYLRSQEVLHNGHVRRTFFRHKKYGWKTFALLLEFSNNKAYERIFAEDPFMQMFLSNICLRPSCYACKFKSLSRPSDITIGDCWGIDNIYPDMDDDKGTSIVFAHSEKGMDLLKKIWGEMTYKEGNIEELLPNTADSRKSVSPHPNRNTFFAALDAGENCDELLKFVKPKVSILGKVKRKIKVIIRID